MADFTSIEGFRLDGRRALVAGATGGIGRGIALALRAAGAEVVAAGRRLDKLAGAGFETVALGEGVAGIRAAVEAAGPVDLLVNAIGIHVEEALLEVTEEGFDRVWNANLKTAMFLAQAVAAGQIARGRGGRQVHLLSVRSQLGIRGRGYSAYCSSKGGLAMLVKQHALELAPHGITVNGVAPTFVRTPMIDRFDQATLDRLAERIPLGRIGEVADVTGPVLFMLSPAAGFVTGQVLFVDGGITAGQ